MEVLTQEWQRLCFTSQQQVLRHRWLTGMLLFTGLLTGLVLQAWWQQQSLQQRLQQLPAPSLIAAKTAKPEATKPLMADTVLTAWPSEEDAERISAEILTEADAMGMIFERAEFQSLPVAHASLQVQRIKLPLKGEYLQVRQFLRQVLQRYPSLALSQFKLQRTDVMQPVIEAYVEFSLYTRKRGQS
jgi:hypothetical protein